jgi:hypothetical protein
MSDYRNIAATTNLKNSAGKLKGIFVSAASATPTITIYDSSTTTTTKTIISVFTPTAATMYPLMPSEGGIFFSNGLYVSISGTVSATFIYE